MRKITFAICILLLIIPGRTGADQPASDAHVALAQFTQAHIGEIDDWNVTIKENMDHETINQWIDVLRDKDGVSVKDVENAIEYVWTSGQRTNHISEHYKIILPKNTKLKASFIVTITGMQWDERVRQAYLQRKRMIHERFFTDNARLFACLSTEIHDIIESVFIKNKLRDELKLVDISVQHDNVNDTVHNTYVYGYTPLWHEYMTVLDKPVNFHMAINDKQNGPVTYTIGTPILINEY
ncbi:MAG TPA: YwmB family TATA-box binding protein [Bacillota bacterium]|nr:YwmB family TATA-box binding protein [Bacillota bacterium]